MTRQVLVTGASGYVAGRLIPALLEQNWQVRVLTRSASSIADREWAEQVQVCVGDATRVVDLDRALDGVQVAYYLLHSMAAGADFRRRDRTLATSFAERAAAAGVSRIVYLSGLHPDGELSDHLASRVEVGEILLRGEVPATVLQAGIVLGAGSASYDMLRHLTERLPAMIAPKWLRNRIQPIAVDDAVHYLMAAAEVPAELNRTIDIGGPEVLTYAEMMRRYAAVTGLPRRVIVTVPVLSPRLASHWIGLVTPVDAHVAKPLIGSLIHDAVADEDDLTVLPEPPGGRIGYDEALRRALTGYDPHRWRRTVASTGAGVLAAAVTGTILTTPGSRWYRSLAKPRWQPPPAAFPIVWTSLYTGIAVAGSAARAELPAEQSTRFSAALAANLAINAGWTGLFFRAHRLRLSTAGAAMLALSAADLTRRAAPSGPGKAVVFGAYTAWCCVATALNVAVTRRNATPLRRGWRRTG